MPLGDVRGMLAAARRRGRAVGSFNVFNLETIEAVLAAAAARRSPVIVAFTERLATHFDLEILALVVRHRAASLGVPIGLHLDHGQGQAGIRRAIRAGFTSVMYDGAGIPYEEKIHRTRAIVETAQAAGVAVEAELGYVPRGSRHGEVLADPGLVADFVKRTGVDVVAVAIGSVHGLRAGEAHLDFARLRAIRRETDAHLSLHGSSGIADAELRRGIREGITKISYFTAASRAASLAMRASWRAGRVVPPYADLSIAARQEFQAKIEERLEVYAGTRRRRTRAAES
ncbi:MAG TPA: class II fructose-bisphosphate aldolase [Candidatus Methylomirabilis sp.]|nr:class II fructose-bisphosphate aldolase [Candidatus Methylomirabilis sp.]